MNEPRWLSASMAVAAHERQLARFGGPAGIRDQGALESALGRPINKYQYENADLAVCAAAYAFGIARNHPFVDGNKRVAFVALTLFLRLNDVVFSPDRAEATAIMFGLAAGEIEEEGLTRWIRDNWPEAVDAPMQPKPRGRKVRRKT